MGTALRRVARGMRLIVRGLGVLHVALGALIFLPCLCSLLPVPEEVRVWASLGLTGLLAAAGVALVLVGRGLCLFVPPVASAARARIVLTVLLEWCGLASGAACVANVIGGWLPDVAVWVGGGFALAATLASRVMFLLFARSLAAFVETPPWLDTTRRLLIATAGYAAGLLGGALGIALLVRAKEAFGWDELVGVVAGLVYLLFILYAVGNWFKRYTGMLTALSERVEAFAAGHPDAGADDDPDREYRERYEEGY